MVQPSPKLCIPDIQHEIDNLCARLKALSLETYEITSRLEVYNEMLSRRPPIGRAPVRSRRLTEAVEVEIIECRDQHPDWSQQQIADEVGVNPGRVSETLAGKLMRKGVANGQP
jgi:hypothetical protein